MARVSVLFVLLCAATAAMANHFIKPYRVGPLMLSTSLTGGEMVQGTVYLTDSSTVFITNFQLSTGASAIFCAGRDSLSNIELPITVGGSAVIPNGHSSAEIEVPLPSGTTATSLVWVGVCATGDPNTVIASAFILPAYVPYLPCNTTTLSQFTTTTTPAPVAGWAFLLNRVTFAVLSFDYSGQAPDARFWVGAGAPSGTGLSCTYENNINTALVSGTDDQDFLVHLPAGAVGQAIDYLAVFCQGANVAEGQLPVSMGQVPTLPPPNPTSVQVGTFAGLSHNVGGTMHALSSRQIELRDFSFDGGGLTIVFYASTASILGGINDANSITVSFDNGATELSRAYNGETVDLLLPVNDAITNYNFLSVWCRPAQINFGAVTIPDNLMVPDGTAEIPTLPPVQECPVLTSSITTNCFQLHPSVTVSWVVDQNSGTITFNLCGCVRPNEYIAFGISGSETGALMVGGDVTWTWLDNTGVHAGDLDLTAYSQCILSSQIGACPDTQDDVIPGSVSGFRDNCTTCIKFSRPLSSTDSRDRAFTPGTAQAIIWSSGPVGSIDNDVTGTTIPVPFQHYENMRPRRGDLISIDFGRTPVDECTLQCVDCEVPVVPWVQPVLPHTTTITAQIGNSGGRQGYEGITGTSGWGIAWYLNGLLIPTVTVRRGTNYTFITEGGNDPSDGARYHPFYITDSSRGGFLQTAADNQQAETIYAGFDGTTPIGVGRLCAFEPTSGQDRADELSSFETYFGTLELSCAEGSAGSFTWMPTKDTPDVVYYQCATHQFLGWKINVVNDLDPTVDPTVVPTMGASSVPLSASLLLLLLCAVASLQCI